MRGSLSNTKGRPTQTLPTIGQTNAIVSMECLDAPNRCGLFLPLYSNVRPSIFTFDYHYDTPVGSIYFSLIFTIVPLAFNIPTTQTKISLSLIHCLTGKNVPKDAGSFPPLQIDREREQDDPDFRLLL